MYIIVDRDQHIDANKRRCKIVGVYKEKTDALVFLELHNGNFEIIKISDDEYDELSNSDLTKEDIYYSRW